MLQQNEQTLFFIRDEQDEKKISTISRTNTNFSSTEKIMTVEKRAVIIPVGIIKQKVHAGGISKWASYIQDPETKDLIHQGVFFTTALDGIPSDQTSTYALLMHENVGNPVNSGRGGVLMKKNGQNYEPILLTIDEYEYVLDLKGTGTPHGVLDEESGSGVLKGGAEKEYHSLFDALYQHPNRDRPVSWLSYPISHVYLDGKFIGQIARAVPVTYRPSYKNGEIEDVMSPMEHEKKTEKLFAEISRYLAFSPPRIATNHWLDNTYFVNGIQKEIVATDFMEIGHFHQTAEPWIDFEIGIEVAVGGCPKVELSRYFSAINEGLASVNPEKKVDWEAFYPPDKDFEPALIVRAIMESFLAVDIYTAQVESGIRFNRNLVEHFIGAGEMRRIAEGRSFEFRYIIANYIRDQIRILEIVVKSQKIDEALRKKATQDLVLYTQAHQLFLDRDILQKDSVLLMQLENLLKSTNNDLSNHIL